MGIVIDWFHGKNKASNTNLVLFEITPVLLGVDHEPLKSVWITHLEVSCLYTSYGEGMS